MIHELPVDIRTLIDNKCSGSEYAVYLYIKHRLVSEGEEAGLGLHEIKHGYDPKDYDNLVGISRDEIRDSTGYTLKQVKNAVDKLRRLDLAIPLAGDNGRYYYQIHFRLPFIDYTRPDPTKLYTIR